MLSLVRGSWFTEDHRKVVFDVISNKLTDSDKPIFPPGMILHLSEAVIRSKYFGDSVKTQLARLAELNSFEFAHMSLDSLPGLVKIWRIKLSVRDLRSAAESLVDRLSEPPSPETFETIIPALIEKQHEIWSSACGSDEGSCSMSDTVDELLKPLPPDVSIPTGIKVLDKTIQGGVAKRFSQYSSRLIVIAARPGMGKTALAVHIAAKIAESHGETAYFSLEMPPAQIHNRSITWLDYYNMSGQGGSVDLIRSENLMTRRYTPDQIERLKLYKTSDLARRMLVFSSMKDIGSIASKIRLLSRTRERLSAVFIDYLQLIDGCDADGLSTEASNIGKVTKALKRLCISFGIDIFLLSQVNRGVEQRVNKMPVMSDLRGSGRIEEDADIVMFMMRPGYYDEGKDPYELAVSVDKNRHGQSGTLRCGIDLRSNYIFDVLSVN